MTTFLFWNLQKKPLTNLIVQLAQQHLVDVLIFSEFAINPTELLYKLNDPETRYDYTPQTDCDKITIFSSFPQKFISPVLESSRLTIRHLSLPGLQNILLAATHFPSQQNWSRESQSAEASRLRLQIQQAENNIKHRRTVLVGDLNMNPFDPGLINANGLHGVMSEQIAKQKIRTVQGEHYPFFYNPMWNLFGDWAEPASTYYYRGSSHTEYFWYMFDQVLIRPTLLDAFDTDSLKIIHQVGQTSLLTNNGLPNSTDFSDHLPLIFKLNL